MLIVRTVCLVLTVYIACFFAGELVIGEKDNSLGIRIAYGLMVLWAVFYVVAVAIILKKLPVDRPDIYLDELRIWGSNTLTLIYSVMVILIVSGGLIKYIVSAVKGKKISGSRGVVLDRTAQIYLSVFLALVLFQLIKSVFFAYADGDDAFYVSTVQLMASGDNTLYRKIPYTGNATGLTARYGMAPFPVWVGYWGRLFKLTGATTAHVCMPLIFIPITYVIYNAIAVKLFEDNRVKRYLFLMLISVFVLFSHYSYNSAEVFMLTRSRQGKEALACIIIPLLLYWMIIRTMRDKLEYDVKSYILIIFISLGAALTSVFGNMLFLILMFGHFVYAFYKKAGIKYITLTGLTAVLPLIILVVYYTN